MAPEPEPEPASDLPPAPPVSAEPEASQVRPAHDPLGQLTPPQPLPDPLANEHLPAPAEAPAPSEAPGALRLAGAGVGHALRCWRPLLAVWLVQLLLALTVALPFHAAVSARLGEHPHAAALAGAPSAVDRALGWEAGMDAGLWRDTRRELARTFEALPVTLAWMLLIAWLFGAVAAAGFLGLKAEPGPCSASRFFACGGKGFFRMLRVGVVFAVAFAVVARLVHEGWGAAVADTEAHAATGATGWWGERGREALLFGLFLVLRVVADLARADLIAGGRRSALLAFLRRLGTVVKHPLRTLGVAALLGAPVLLLLGGLSLLLEVLPQGGWRGVLALFLVLQVAVLLRWASRAALLGAWAVRVLPPLHRKPT